MCHLIIAKDETIKKPQTNKTDVEREWNITSMFISCIDVRKATVSFLNQQIVVTMASNPVLP